MKLLFATILIIASINNHSFAGESWVDNKELCEKTKGNWRMFNNECADSCDSQFDFITCTSIPKYNCECGKNRCWDGGKCISTKVAQKYWDKKKEEIKAQREAELKEFKIKQEAAAAAAAQKNANNILQNNSQQNQQSVTQNSINTSVYSTSSAPYTDPVQNTSPAPKTETASTTTPIIQNVTPNPTAITKPEVIDPEIQRQNEARQKLCESKNGLWKEFGNGCAGNCNSRISKFSMCSQAITLGCECGENKCWDVSSNSCVNTEEYRQTITGKTVTTNTSSPSINSLTLPSIAITSPDEEQKDEGSNSEQKNPNNGDFLTN